MLGRVTDQCIELLLQVVQPRICFLATERDSSTSLSLRRLIEALVRVTFDQRTSALKVALLWIVIVESRVGFKDGISYRRPIGCVPRDSTLDSFTKIKKSALKTKK